MTGSGMSNLLHFMVLMAVIYLIFYFLLIRPQSKKQKQHEEMLNNLRKGDRVITSGGIYGTVSRVKDEVVVLQVAENVRIDVAKSAIATLKERGEDRKTAGLRGGGESEQ
ncbi:MAG: preprotein translocase subunit YajC [Candidatus Tectomicrobia bacterium]|uniref:Sec translocon accessory complex subunit YajC n=1 Tax=Tectimicrobiota bacterium TaxID=2528274 RepID=A0A932FWJ1_UNCTE|nr:preprotein translocase subunit YajC [Candidatus Tectomicrobia bacterium]